MSSIAGRIFLSSSSLVMYTRGGKALTSLLRGRDPYPVSRHGDKDGTRVVSRTVSVTKDSARHAKF